MPLNRRQCLAQTGIAALSASQLLANLPQNTRRILLRSSWQTVNIGDIAHTPGILRILETYLPDVEIYLYPSNLDNGVDSLLLSRFPKLKIAKKGSKLLDEAFETCDFLLHGSGASLVAERQVVQWREQTGKPYGIYGITLPEKRSSSTTATPEDVMAKTVQVLSGAKFVFFRDSKSLELAKKLGVDSPVMEFGPDAAFACDLRDDAKADAFLKQHQLETGKFLCCIPRLRYTPYWTIKENAAFDPEKNRRNEQMKEHDHAPLRQAIIDVVKHTDLKVLVCPEDRTQMKVGKEMIYDKLPSNLLERVVWKPNYWLTGEAVSTFVRSAGLFGNEMHSPIMCIGHGIPAIVCRFAEQTTKGFMWDDIGLGEWLFDLDDESSVQRIAPTVLAMATDPQGAKAKAEQARRFVVQRQRETMDQLKSDLGD
ncbi:polysaccharide pyruvyl transferase family protein [Stieleria sp. TO1_6]|uniref:polysaccharide pyruvyl transferase family protein n=1 Tax=Stieleria tagensis TaxID=2956795 RepID=UPI00209A7AF5|nr:polysaccharide pyruvyl transferase family protein [Stieleria tagensis]MCO8121587.1 polysaccharide pyruvyl transferase family protein [Stieleria tagensis]